MKKYKGLSLVELIVVIAIVAVLATIAIPTYANYIIRTKVGSILGIVGPLKVEVSEKVYLVNSFDGISSSGSSLNGLVLPAESNSNLSYITSVTDGVITASIIAPVTGSIVLTPAIVSGSINWDCTSDLPSNQRPNSCGELVNISDSYTSDSSGDLVTPDGASSGGGFFSILDFI